MKITSNSTIQFSNYKPISVSKNQVRSENSSDDKILASGLTYANFPNITFGCKGMNADMKFLLNQVHLLRCAYSGMPMLAREDAEYLYRKLEKRTNAHDTINFLNSVKEYMHDTEKKVYDLLSEEPSKRKCDFHDILNNYYDYSLEQLKSKQLKILSKANRVIKTLSEPVKEQVLSARDDAFANLGNAKLARKCLQRLKEITADGRDLEGVRTIFHTWYSLPSPSKDLDAFIVKYAPESHLTIAKRLISSSVATVEHVQPSARGGADDLSNYILVSEQFNNSRSSMPLWEYIMLNPEYNINANLEKYLLNVKNLTQSKKSSFAQKQDYFERIQETIKNETNSVVELDGV